jgi:hypothetical protein
MTQTRETREEHPLERVGITVADVIAAIEEDACIGFCRACGADHWGSVEPDARNYVCESCGRPEVFGAEELLLMYA